MGALTGTPGLSWRRAMVRAVVLAMVVGSALVLINHGDHLMSEPICDRFFLKCALSYLTPFVVSLLSTALTAADRQRDGGEAR